MLLSVDEYLSRQSYDYEIIVVNDGSEDRTAEVVSNLKFKTRALNKLSARPSTNGVSALVKNLKLIGSNVNRGKGWAVRQGMLEAQGNYRLFMDADNSTTIDHLEKFWPNVERGNDVIIASIAVAGAQVAKGEKFYRRLLGKLGNLWIQFWVLPGIWDSQRGFKLFSARAAEAIFPKLKISRWGFDVEVLALARKLGFKIKEVPIRWDNEGESKVKPSAYFQVLLEVLKIRWNSWTGKYKI